MRPILAGVTALLVAACATPGADVEVQPLVDAAWLNDNLDAVVVLDIRSGRAENQDPYASGHVPGAIHSGYGQDPWRVTRDGVPGMLPPVEDLEQLIGGLGISNDDYVVIVPAGTSAGEFGTATRVYWEFKVLGHQRVSILNGGYGTWEEAGYPIATEPVDLRPVTYTADYQPQLVASQEDVIAALDDGTPLIDARSVNYYEGEAKSRAAARYGTIHRAKNVPQDRLTVDNGGTFIDADVAVSFWDEAGVPTDGEQITFCNTGHLASLAWFAAYEVLGNKEVKLYDGSLAEWSADPDRPMDNTENPNRE